MLSGSLSLTPLDNNYSNPDIGKEEYNTAYITVESVNEESGNTLAKKVDLLCKDIYSPTRDEWGDPIDIKILNSETGCLYKEFNIKLREKKHDTFNSTHWEFSASDRDNEIAIMPIKKGVLNKMGDLNLLAVSFIFATASLEFFLKD